MPTSTLVLPVLLAALQANPLPAEPLPLNNRPLLVPLYEVYSAQYNDYFYSVDESQVDLAISLFGYGGKTEVAHLERRQQPGTLPFKRYYRDYPEYNHFYTKDLHEQQLIDCAAWPSHCVLDYQYEGIEGYIHDQQQPGSLALLRLNRWDPASGNQVHRYTTDASLAGSLQAQGWSLDGVAGYVYQDAQPAWSDASGSGFMMGLRCPGPASDSHPASAEPCFANSADARSYRDFHFPTQNVDSKRPAGRKNQRISFTFRSPDFFGKTPAQGGGDHLAVGFHGFLNSNYADVTRFCPLPGAAPGSVGECTWQRGLGINLWQDQGPFGGQFNTEAWWVPNSAKDVSVALRQGSRLSWFTNNTTYYVNATVSELPGGPHGVGGQLNVTIRNAYGHTVTSASWDSRSQPALIPGSSQWQLPFTAASPFPLEITSVFFAAANSARRDYTVYIDDIRISWY